MNGSPVLCHLFTPTSIRLLLARRFPRAMTERDAIYVQILHHGLLRIRDSAALGHLQYCAIESEHLHNIPSLVGETNEKRHEHYFDKERNYYLERLDRTIPNLDYTLRRYDELWAQLKQLNESRASSFVAESVCGPHRRPQA